MIPIQPAVNGEESKEYFNIVNIGYYDTILGTLFLKKFKVMIDFMKDCLKIKDNHTPASG